MSPSIYIFQNNFRNIKIFSYFVNFNKMSLLNIMMPWAKMSRTALIISSLQFIFSLLIAIPFVKVYITMSDLIFSLMKYRLPTTYVFFLKIFLGSFIFLFLFLLLLFIEYGFIPILISIKMIIKVVIIVIYTLLSLEKKQTSIVCLMYNVVFCLVYSQCVLIF